MTNFYATGNGGFQTGSLTPEQTKAWEKYTPEQNYSYMRPASLEQDAQNRMAQMQADADAQMRSDAKAAWEKELESLYLAGEIDPNYDITNDPVLSKYSEPSSNVSKPAPKNRKPNANDGMIGPIPYGPMPIGPVDEVTPDPVVTPDPNGGTTPSDGDLVDIFQPDLYPTSYSGLPQEWVDQLAKLMPYLIDSIENYESNIDASTKAAQELYESQTRQMMTDELQNILNSMAGKNMLGSTVASDAIGRGMAYIVQSGANKGYESAMMNAGLKAQLPSLLGNVLSLGSSSFDENPLAPYELLAQYDWNMS